MLTRNNRFHGYGSLNYLFHRGKTERMYYVSLRVVPNKRRDDWRCAVVVAKKVAKTAPQRNRIRRRIYEIVRNQSASIANHQDFAIIVYDSQAADMPTAELHKLITTLLKRGGVTTDTTEQTLNTPSQS